MKAVPEPTEDLAVPSHAAAPEEFDPFFLFRRELREVLEDVEGLGLRIHQGLTAVIRALDSGRPPRPVDGLRIEEVPDGFLVFLELPEADQGRFDVQLEEDRLEISARSPARGAATGAGAPSSGPWTVRFSAPIDGKNVRFSADAGGIRVRVPKHRASVPPARSRRRLTVD